MTTGSNPEEPAAPPASSSPEELLRLRLAVESSGEVIFMTDARGTITYVNPEFVRVYGYTAGEVVGRTTPRILNSGATSPDEYASFWRQLLGRQVVRREFLNRTKDGSQVLIESSANPILMNNELVGFLAVQRDITSRKATEEALHESLRRYRVLANAAHDAIFIVNRDEIIEYTNVAGTEHFGVRCEDAVGKPLREIFPSAVAEEMWRELSTVFTTSERQYFETRFDTQSGDIWLGAWLVPIADNSGSITSVMGVARDISDHKRLEREFAQAQKMEAVGRLAGGIAHDFNNLLTAIVGYSELLIDRRLDQEIVADLGEIRKAGERASSLTRQLLTFSRKQPFLPQVLDVNLIVADLHKMIGRIIGEDIRVDVVVEPALAHTKADPGHIEQLILNLAVNARDAMPQGGTLRIATANAEVDRQFAARHGGAVPGRYVSLSVQDTGCGMTADVLAHVFEPFFTTKPVGKGTGLGLATVYGIVKQSGGFIAIDSTPAVGTTVSVYLPIVGDAPVAQTGTVAPVPSLGGTETILLVEDELGLRRLMQRTLEHRGYTVLAARDIRHAIDIAEQRGHQIDLLLSDVVMPEMNGPELAQRVIRLRPSIRVLYVSGFSNQAAFDGGAMSPRTCFLAKPFTPAALTTKVRECLDRQPAVIKGENV